MNTKKQGDVGLGKAIEFCTSLGWTVCLPLTDSQDYDFVVDDGKMKRVQVKTSTYRRNRNYEVSLTVKGGNRTSIGKIKIFDSTKVDYLFVYTADGSLYFIPSMTISNKHSITLSRKYDVWRVKPVGLGSGL